MQGVPSLRPALFLAPLLLLAMPALGTSDPQTPCEKTRMADVNLTCQLRELKKVTHMIELYK